MAAYTFAQVKIGTYEFVTNPTVVDNDPELLQTTTRSINGTLQSSYIPKSGDTTKIMRKKSFTIQGEDNDKEQIELIQAELETAGNIYFRDAQGNEYQVYVTQDLKFPNDASLWEQRNYTFSVSEI